MVLHYTGYNVSYVAYYTLCICIEYRVEVVLNGISTHVCVDNAVNWSVAVVNHNLGQFTLTKESQR